MLFFPDANAAVPVQVWQIMYNFEDFNKQKPTYFNIKFAFVFDMFLIKKYRFLNFVSIDASPI